MPKLTIDGRPVEVAPGTNLIEAARQLGIEIPHYCYHPALSIAGACRLCMVDIEKAPRPTIACNTQAADGMVVHTQTPRVLETRRSVMEWHLINHPLDCPVCDQAGECWLQIYYMQHGLYEPRMIDDKVHKPKAVPLGRYVMLDAERCILCSRCVRFCDEVSKTGELGIFNRGDHSEIGLFPGTTLDNAYSGNVIDICPVGALTDRDFRFRVRVWYLDRGKSVCPGCARGCNTEVHTNTRRLHQSRGRRVARLKPRFNQEVNRWWLCDEGRYGFHDLDAPTRLLVPQRRTAGGQEPAAWPEAVRALADRVRAAGPDRVGVLLSPKLANEDLWLARRLFREVLGVRHLDFRVPPREPGVGDDFLIRADKNPNSRGAELLDLGSAGEEDGGHVLAAAEAGRLSVLWIFGHDLFGSRWPEIEVGAALDRVECVVFQGPNGNPTSERAHFLLPSATYVEREGTFTNFEGRVQRFWKAVEPLGEARADWEILADVARALGQDWRPARAEALFRELAAAVPVFGGLTYRELRDRGALVRTG
ncbi:MAG TPA: molybdopterin-dependent oxidoreductase [Methylomirabilota bacterium]|jgi:NADH-quinone oxidoreductase subunit G|nr:molybdopterin-dependent oxidoreductase [Methylomirabilota bacterium]